MPEGTQNGGNGTGIPVWKNNTIIERICSFPRQELAHSIATEVVSLDLRFLGKGG